MDQGKRPQIEDVQRARDKLCDRARPYLTVILISPVDPRVGSTGEDQAGSGASAPEPEGGAPESQIC